MSEAKRKMVRLSVLIFPGLYLFLDKNTILYFLGSVCLILTAFEISRFRFPEITKTYFRYFSWMAKERERGKISGITWIASGAFLSILFFEKDIAIIALLFTIFGDAAAALVRTKIEKIKPFGKGLEGNFAMLAVCILIGVAARQFSVLSLPAISASSLAATFTELIPLKIKEFYVDDNFSIALVSGLVLTLLS